MKKNIRIGIIMVLAFVGGFWLTQYVMKKLGAKDEEKQAEVWENRVEEYSSENNNPHMGDIIFQTSTSDQSFAIQEASNSPYSHVGIIERIKGEFFVLEGVQPVKRTALKDWINRGEDSKYVIKRIRNIEYLKTEKGKQHWQQLVDSYLGKPYDSYFQWSDDRIYCSELVWKIFNQLLGIEIGELKELNEFDWHSIEDQLLERYGDNIPWEEKIISPQAIFNSPLLIEIKSTY